SDSGAPDVWETAQGTVSWGSEDGIPPGVYTSVSIFIPWIQETMKRLTYTKIRPQRTSHVIRL
ncbi:unnamed protein product, partial [Lepidochelys olivacea]